MLTVRRMERLWEGTEYARLARGLLEMRPEASGRAAAELARASCVAALCVVRLDELSQPHHPLCGRMIRTILSAQESDGGWGDPIATSMCLRALLCSGGSGPAMDRGMTYLAGIQRDEGIWPRVPLRRMPSDPFVSAFILFQLSGAAAFQERIRLPDALAWFEAHQTSLDRETARLWRSIRVRRHAATSMRLEETIWS